MVLSHGQRVTDECDPPSGIKLSLETTAPTKENQSHFSVRSQLSQRFKNQSKVSHPDKFDFLTKGYDWNVPNKSIQVDQLWWYEAPMNRTRTVVVKNYTSRWYWGKAHIYGRLVRHGIPSRNMRRKHTMRVASVLYIQVPLGKSPQGH